LSNLLRPGRYRLHLRELCLVAGLLLTSGCGGAYTLGPLPQLSPSSPGIAWLSPLHPPDAREIARWRSAVGPPIVSATAAAVTQSTDAVTIVSWNVALDRGDVVQLVRGLQVSAPKRPIVLLLQEAFRGGDDVPAAATGAGFASHLGRCDPGREVDDVARELGFALYYVPSMRNGGPGRREDRGNAVLSSLPLDDLSAIELPFERQRRVAVAATIRGTTSSGDPWALRLASVHLDNLVGARYGWIATVYGRARQARGLREALAGVEPLVMAGDFNTWFGFSDQAYIETARAFPHTRVQDGRRTFRGLLRLDHVFYRLAPQWAADVRRAESSFGSDHHPLITTVVFGAE
jgi:endonuclease/exonuclease/phosphatase family metal-dependent hydrolase